MNKLAFSLVVDKNDSKFDISLSQKLYWIGLVGLMLCLLFTWSFDRYLGIKLFSFKVVVWASVGFCIMLASGNIFGLIDFNGNNKKTKGFITFDENELTINHAKIFNYYDIDKIVFSGFDYKGAYININSDGGPLNSYGGDNYVEFISKDKTYKFQFIVNSKSHRTRLIEDLIPKMKLKTMVKY